MPRNRPEAPLERPEGPLRPNILQRFMEMNQRRQEQRERNNPDPAVQAARREREIDNAYESARRRVEAEMADQNALRCLGLRPSRLQHELLMTGSWPTIRTDENGVTRFERFSRISPSDPLGINGEIDPPTNVQTTVYPIDQYYAHLNGLMRHNPYGRTFVVTEEQILENPNLGRRIDPDETST